MPTALLVASLVCASPSARLLTPTDFFAAAPETTEKSTSLLVAGGELGLGLVGGYLALIAGVAINFPLGGASLPPDTTDLVLLAALPAATAAAGAWLFGLFDLSQRGFVTSLILAALGAAVGEAAGVAAGLYGGRALYPNDPATAGLVAMAAGPVVAALGATLFMELFKGGKSTASATLLLSPASRGSFVLQPGMALRF